jgi:hypothetical protein
MFIHTVCAALEKAEVPYAVVGGYAVALHGAVRGTVDVDIVIRWTLGNLQKAENALKTLGLVSLIPINSNNLFHFKDEYIHNKHLIAWNFYDPSNPLNQVDIIITYDLKSLRHTKIVHTASGNIRILAREDLIQMKKNAGRPQDLQDVKALEDL